MLHWRHVSTENRLGKKRCEMQTTWDGAAVHSVTPTSRTIWCSKQKKRQHLYVIYSQLRYQGKRPTATSTNYNFRFNYFFKSNVTILRQSLTNLND